MDTIKLMLKLARCDGHTPEQYFRYQMQLSLGLFAFLTGQYFSFSFHFYFWDNATTSDISWSRAVLGLNPFSGKQLCCSLGQNIIWFRSNSSVGSNVCQGNWVFISTYFFRWMPSLVPYKLTCSTSLTHNKLIQLSFFLFPSILFLQGHLETKAIGPQAIQVAQL